MEIEVVRHAFEASGAKVYVVQPATCTVDDFLAKYKQPEFDVFWVMSHGEFDHWSPRHVKLQLARDHTSATLEDLHGLAPQADERRLLVLNVCDGARFEEIGLIPQIGLAPALAGPEQATISHLWPVLGYPSAAFGAYLAISLAQGTAFFNAYKQAVTSMRQSAHEIARELEQLLGYRAELVERLSLRDEDFGPIQISGSAAFFQ